MRERLKLNNKGVQTLYPSIAKIVGRGVSKVEEDGASFVVPLYYGTGEYVAEYGPWGIVVTNWHVVSESDTEISVRFPERPSCVAQCVLRDEKWDLAALLIEKPKGLKPTPISVIAPTIGEYLWAGGYGPKEGLDEFEIKCGELVNYVSLDMPKEKRQGAIERYPTELIRSVDGSAVEIEPLYETLMIDLGVRSGDSGGPVFNRFGELVGCLWGSDKKNSMATSGARMSLFVMDALQEAADLLERQRAESEEFPDSGVTPGLLFSNGEAPNHCKRASDRYSTIHIEYVNNAIYQVMASERQGETLDEALIELSNAKYLLNVRGLKTRFYPVFSERLYASGNEVDTSGYLASLTTSVGVSDEEARQRLEAAYNHVKEVADAYWTRNPDSLPPNPPLFSDSFLALQIMLNEPNPEVIGARSFDSLTRFATSLVESERRPKNRQSWAMDDEDSRKLSETSTAERESPAEFKEASAVKSPSPVAVSNPSASLRLEPSYVAPNIVAPPLTKTGSYAIFCVFVVLLILGEFWRRSEWAYVGGASPRRRRAPRRRVRLRRRFGRGDVPVATPDSSPSRSVLPPQHELPASPSRKSSR